MQSLAEMPFVAAHPALDFVNTAEERGHPDAGDALLTAADLRYWGNRYGLVTGSTKTDRDISAEFERAIEARELLYVLFLAQASGQPFPAGALERLGELASDAYRAGRLEREAGGTVSWQWDRSALATIRHVAVTSGLELLHSDPSRRLKQCPGDHCGWFFLDTTKRGNRRWCSMSECGQEQKNRRRRSTTT
jgi:predicted RNA-binding Zn ribbon-like protein